jgi:hypothetical protein
MAVESAAAVASLSPALHADAVRSWRNVPDCVKDATVSVVESLGRLAVAVALLSRDVAKRATPGEVADAVAGRAPAGQVTGAWWLASWLR